MSDWFKGFGGASVRGSGNFMAPGVYDLVVQSFIRKDSARPDTMGHKIVICELTVDAVVTAFPADQGTAPVGQQPDFAASNQRGEKVSYIQNFTKHHQMAMGNAKGLLLAMLNVRAMEAAVAAGRELPQLMAEGALSPEQWEQAIEMATNPPGEWAKGIRLRAHVGKTRTLAKKPFSPVTWVPLAPGSAGAVATP